MQVRPDRAIVDALTPTPESFVSATGSESAGRLESSLYSLNASIRTHFPPVKAVAVDPPTNNFHQIESLPHLQRIVLKARSQRRRLRPTTAGLGSPTNRLLLQKGHHVADMSLLTGLTYHASRRVVVAQAGVSIAQLQEFLHKEGFTLMSHAAPSVNARSVAAAFVTGALGTLGRSESLFADGVCEVSLMDSNGRLRVFSSTVDPYLFRALRGSHTLFGIVYDVTLHVFPTRRLVTISNCFTRLTSLLAHRGGALRNTVAMHGGVQVVWFPCNSAGQEKSWTPQEDLVWVRMVDSPPKSKSKRSCALQSPKDVKSNNTPPPPLLRFLSLPQWLTVHKIELAKAGYTEFQRKHALLFAADAFRESAWVLGAGRHIVSALDAAQTHHFDGVRSVRSVSVAFPTSIRYEKLRTNATSDIANEYVDSAESSSELSSDTDDDLDLSGSDDAIDMHDVVCSDGISSTSNNDGWVSVYAAMLSVVRAVHSASKNGGEALAATTRLSIEITGGSSALLAATRGIDTECKRGGGEGYGRRRGCSYVVLTMESAMSASGWGALASSVVRSWSKLRAARWVWDRHSADIVGYALREEQDAHHVQRFLSIDRATEVAQLKIASRVDDVGMFVDEQLDNLMYGLFSKANVPTVDGTGNLNLHESRKSLELVKPHSSTKAASSGSEDRMSRSNSGTCAEPVDGDNEGDTRSSAETKDVVSLSPPESESESKFAKENVRTLTEPVCLLNRRRGRDGDEMRYCLQMVLAVVVAFWIGIYTRELVELMVAWFR